MNRYMISIPVTLAEELASDNANIRAEAVSGLRELLTARSALMFENQQVTPARLRCLACGEYHERSGNLPCPKMRPMSGASE
jgi:hypothetical protein